MRFGIREICDVVLRAKSYQTLGNRKFYKNEPVLYFDTLRTSTLEGAATTVYAQGGRGYSRLIAWEGERTLTFTMEDALLSPESFSMVLAYLMQQKKLLSMFTRLLRLKLRLPILLLFQTRLAGMDLLTMIMKCITVLPTSL